MSLIHNHVPKSAYKTYTYIKRAKHTGYKKLFVALFFIFVGALLFIYPSPPLNPITFAWLQTIVKWMGIVCFIIGLYELYVSGKLIADQSAWRIVIDNDTLVYETPKSVREKSFSCKLEEIDYIEQIVMDFNDSFDSSSNAPIYRLVLKNGQVYPLFEGKNHIDSKRFIDAMRARNIPLTILN